ncbi:hypothetical protein [Actinophytocola sp. NPDC049390]|uniref:hypothetical protein n=1 Tax=Actinophytocola sp. NPDC049390 TaxID=3363894 RepID=UPI0037B7BC51
MAARVLPAGFAAGVAGCLGSVLVPWAVTVPWLIACCGVVFAGSIASGVRRDVRSVTRVELVLETEPRGVVVRGPWVTRRRDLGGVLAIQAWCDCVPVLLPELDPHLDVIEVVSRDGTTVRVTPGTAFGPEVLMTWREWLEPLGVKVVDWRAD